MLAGMVPGGEDSPVTNPTTLPLPSDPPQRTREPVEISDGELHDSLRTTFGFGSFRLGQQEVIEAILSDRDCLAVMPTGSGKSLTYQLAARLLGGTTLVSLPSVPMSLAQSVIPIGAVLFIAAQLLSLPEGLAPPGSSEAPAPPGSSAALAPPADGEAP